MDPRALIACVRRNCDVSDARYAGVFSVCGLALRLRDLYKWEHGLAPWEEGVPAEVLEWIGRREDYWESLSDRDFEPLPLNGSRFDPFDLEPINAVLESAGLYYGAGYARGLKPTFFLAEIVARERRPEADVYTLGRELARDLLALPALSQDRSILLRRQAARSNLWDQIVYAGAAGKRALAAIREAWGLPDDQSDSLKARFADLQQAHEELLLLHELGELHDENFERSLWSQIVSETAHTPIELLVRSVKDLLADTHPQGPLRAICHRRDRGKLGLFMLFLNDFYRSLAPAIPAAFQSPAGADAWVFLAESIEASRLAAVALAGFISSAYRRHCSSSTVAEFKTEMMQLIARCVNSS